MTETRLTFIVWFLLITLTLLGYTVGQLGMSGTGALAILLGAALIKSQLVISHFMEMKHAPSFWKWIPSAWLIVVLGAIILTYQ
ncbi:MAG: cytochrome C oxidase subunit IV family protein [Gammaproteobacteria bacterium]|jgi:cytochrome c oxidase subunit IV|nr:cytochrome C oxidase subunit IV family protein [Gammaproteobacteria bacterium]MBT4607524.1 cytochrome C oxidase subunit IV family protein [Thiotrichales bacterium]MBT3472094.1 cytochrome C oxidase subunit IV family protein [Gammaproteobacteria bacterium]MBT3966731.1 cytochrome C oxidase subunit IV family protein [Gammaproteobacteria bacterium]MBT4079153.1 cytochrome C oxidase subunit IV family protein [Gammaproteobacteria bacterium]